MEYDPNPSSQTVRHSRYLSPAKSQFICFQYGPVCVDAAYRGLGVFPRLFEAMRLGMCERYPIGVTFINRLNPHSYHAHTKKLGMTVVDEFEFNGRPYYGLAFDMARSVLGGEVG